jgi:hypothetical protein
LNESKKDREVALNIKASSGTAIPKKDKPKPRKPTRFAITAKH